MLSAVTKYHNVLRNYDKKLSDLDKSQQFKRETDYFLKNVSKAKNVDQLMADPKLYRYMMNAFGLGEMMYAKAMIRKVLVDGNLARRMRDSRFSDLHAHFAFDTFGDRTTSTFAATTKTVEAYKKLLLEANVSHTSQAAGNGLRFERVISQMLEDKKIDKDNWSYMLLSDRVISKMVFSALPVSGSVQTANFDGKVRLLEKYLSFDDIADPDRRRKLIERAIAREDRKNSPSSYLVGMMKSTVKMSASFSYALSKLRRGGF